MLSPVVSTNVGHDIFGVLLPLGSAVQAIALIKVRYSRVRPTVTVIAITWFIGFAWFFWPVGDENEFYVASLRTCKSTFDDDNRILDYLQGQQREEREARISAKFDKCQQHSEASYRHQFASDKRQIPWVLSVDLITIALGWLSLQGILAIGGWLIKVVGLKTNAGD